MHLFALIFQKIFNLEEIYLEEISVLYVSLRAALILRVAST